MAARPRKAAPLKWYEKVAKGRASRGLREGYRSGLEEKVGAFLAEHAPPVLFETFRIPYVVPQQLRHYTPDFMLPNGIIVETKGVWDATDRAKHLFVRTQYPDLDIRIVFYRASNKIAPGSKTTCGEWATGHGIKWAEKMIPMAWLKEPAKPIDPMAVLDAGPIGYEEFYRMKAKRP